MISMMKLYSISPLYLLLLAALFILVAVINQFHETSVDRVFYPFRREEDSTNGENKKVNNNESFKIESIGSQPIISDQSKPPQCLPPLVKRLRRCLLDILEPSKNFWKSFKTAVADCCKFLEKTLPIHKLKNNDDFKYVILPIEKDEHCRTLTIGIGNDIEAEKKLKALLPQCNFTGVDPILESGKIFEQIGQFLNVAVGNSTSTIEASVLIGKSYTDRNVSSLNFYDVLNQTGPNVDYFFLDAEGAEYAIMPMLRKSGLKPNFSACQISVEIHGYFPSYHMNDAAYKIQTLDLIANSTYLPISLAPGKFYRMFWLDVESEDCVKKYLSNFCD